LKRAPSIDSDALGFAGDGRSVDLQIIDDGLPTFRIDRQTETNLLFNIDDARLRGLRFKKPYNPTPPSASCIIAQPVFAATCAVFSNFSRFLVRFRVPHALIGGRMRPKVERNSLSSLPVRW
jgi:hypothetical protein